MSFLKNLGADTIKNWEENLTAKDIDELETQGIDVTQYRKNLAIKEDSKNDCRKSNC